MNSSRDRIFQGIRAASVPPVNHPQQGTFEGQMPMPAADRFTAEAALAGTELHHVESLEQVQAILIETEQIECSWCRLAGLVLPGNLESPDVQALERLDVVVVPAAFAVGENGSVWVSDDHMPLRVLPFITRHLAVVLCETELVENMHQAYERLEQASYGFGMFLGGPSKTADIEQSLVLGAHGPERYSLFIVPEGVLPVPL